MFNICYIKAGNLPKSFGQLPLFLRFLFCLFLLRSLSVFFLPHSCRLTKPRTFRRTGAAGGVPLWRGGCHFFAFLRVFIIRHIKDRGLNGERSEKAAACPDDIAVNWFEVSTASPKRLSVSPPDTWSEHGQNDYPAIFSKSPGKRNCQRQCSKIFRRPRRPSKNSKKPMRSGKQHLETV